MLSNYLIYERNMVAFASHVADFGRIKRVKFGVELTSFGKCLQALRLGNYYPRLSVMRAG